MKFVKLEQKPKNRKNLFIITGIVLILIIASLIYYFNFYNKEETFSTNTILLKLNIPINGELSQTIKITNDYKKEQKFEVYSEGLDGIVTLDNFQFSLSSGESKEIIISFKDINNKIEVYSGNLIIKTSNFKKEIPVIIGTEDKNNYFAITQKILSEDVSPGGKIKMEIRIFNLVDKEIHNIKSYYIIKNFNNDVLITDNENLAVKDSTSIIKLIDLPKNTKYGKYIFITSINYDHSQAMASSFFEISKKPSVFRFSSDNFIYYLVLLVLIFIFGTIIFFFYFISSRNPVAYLKRQQEREFKKNVEVMKKYEEGLRKQKREEERKRAEQCEEELKKKRASTRRYNQIKEKILEFMEKIGKNQTSDKKLKKELEEKDYLVSKAAKKIKQFEIPKENIFTRLKKKFARYMQKKREEKDYLVSGAGQKLKHFAVSKENIFRRLKNKFKRYMQKKGEEAEEEKKKNEEKRIIEEEQKQKKIKEEPRTGIIVAIQQKLKELNFKKNKILANLKKKHKKQLEEVKELKKEKKKEVIKEKLDEWKTEGEEMVEIQKELKIPKTKINKILEKKGENVEKEFMKKFYSDLKGKKNKF
ncbi:MAG: hypothetical protein Q7R52_04350 [archaeon]|nr:hypothetical protein [archaeon]